MNHNRINGYDMYDYVVSGANRVIHHEKVLNKINVFPIADSDTGSNLSYTMKCIIAKADRSEHVSQTLTSISHAASEDSFGNSGTIFASYFNGLAAESKNKSTVSAYEFASMAQSATSYAYDAVAAPEEGTILTVMREWSDFLVKHAYDIRDVKTLLSRAFEHAKYALENTKHQLHVLRDSNVVDAGALGFIYFLEGILEFLDSKKALLFTHNDYTSEMIKHDDKALSYRYCCEFLVEGLDQSAPEYFKRLFKTSSDSMVISHSGIFTKLHCHTDKPEALADFLTEHGQIIKSKVDDMKVQQSRTKQKKKSIGILTDTIADIPQAWIEKYNISRIPLQLIIGGNVFVDRYTITHSNLFKHLEHASEYPTSGQPGEVYIKKTLENMLDHYDDVLGIFVSSRMSGLFDKVQKCANDVHSKRIHIFDSKNNSASQGLIIHDAIQLIEKGCDIELILEILAQNMNKYHIHVEIPDLHYATKSGRVPKVLGHIVDLLNRNVIISINDTGKGIVCLDRSLDQIINKIRKSHKIENYVIVHSLNPDDAQKYSDIMESITGKPPLYIEEISSVVASFVGKGSVGIGYKDE